MPIRLMQTTLARLRAANDAEIRRIRDARFLPHQHADAKVAVTVCMGAQHELSTRCAHPSCRDRQPGAGQRSGDSGRLHERRETGNPLLGRRRARDPRPARIGDDRRRRRLPACSLTLTRKCEPWRRWRSALCGIRAACSTSSARASAGVDIDLVMRALYILAIAQARKCRPPHDQNRRRKNASPRQVVRARHSGIAWRAYRRPALRSRRYRRAAADPGSLRERGLGRDPRC